MKEDKKHLYRIDPLKVQQKIYEMYPENSEVRKMMLKEQQIKEYGQLAKTIATMPVDMATASIDNSKKLVLFGMARTVVFLALAFSLTFIMPLPLLLQNLIVFLATATFFAMAMKDFLETVGIVQTLVAFNRSLRKAQERLEKLKKDIFE